MQHSKLRISGKEKMQFMGNLSTMLKAGIPILEAIDSLLEEAKGNLSIILQTIKDDLRAGTVINKSLMKFPETFDKVTVNLIKAAEEAGNLEVALKDAQESLQKEMEFSDKVRSALMYPSFVLLIFFSVMLTMLIVVMPRVSQVFKRLNMDLPLMTRIMIKSSEILTTHYLLIGSGLFVFILGVVIFYKYNRRAVSNAIFSLPILSGLMRQIDLTKFSSSMTLLLGSGLPIVACLDLAEEVVIKTDLYKLLIEAKSKVMAGEKLADGLRSDKNLVSGIIVKLIEVGERTGTLQQSMKDVSEMLDYEVTKQLNKSTSVLEPVMLVFVGLTVGTIMMSIIGPMYGLISNVTPR